MKRLSSRPVQLALTPGHGSLLLTLGLNRAQTAELLGALALRQPSIEFWPATETTAPVSSVRTVILREVEVLQARLAHLNTTILPALARGCTVVVDAAYWLTRRSSLALNGCPEDLVSSLETIERAAWGEWRPRAVVVPSERGQDSQPPELLWGRPNAVIRWGDGASLDGLVGTNRDARPPALGPAQTVLEEPERAQMRRAVFRSIHPAKPTEVYDTYWRLAAERQAIFMRRSAGKPAPWTDDPILLAHKFTNAYRASDRVSQYLLREVIYSGDFSDADLYFRILLFKLFNRIDTWELLKSELGDITLSSYSYTRYDRVLSAAMARGQKIYSAAYIMPSAGRVFGVERKHQSHLLLLERMVKDEAWKKVKHARSLSAVFEILLDYPSIGEFLAYQYAIDLNYSPLINFSEDDFVMPGPGALDGISKCFSDRGGLTEAEIIGVVCERQDEEFRRLGIRFQDLWGRKLHLIDCQNLFCEVSKYARVKHPEVQGVAGRTRIKQVFEASPGPIRLTYPPKWGINQRVQDWQSRNLQLHHSPPLFTRKSNELF